MTILILTIVVVITSLYLWVLARRARYGKAADGAWLCVVGGWAAMYALAGTVRIGWPLLLAIAGALCLTAMAVGKAELK